MPHLKPHCARAATLWLALALTTATAAAQSLNSPPAGTDDLKTILDSWSQSSSQIKSVSAQFSRTGKGLGWGSVEYRYTLKWREPGQAVLDVAEVKRKEKLEPVERFLWTGKELWRYDSSRKEIEIMKPKDMKEYSEFRAMMKLMPLSRALVGTRFDLIFPALHDPKAFEPLPFLLGFDEAAEKRFRFELLESTDPKRFVIRATPLLPAQQLSYSAVLITLHASRFLPISLEYHSGRGGREILRYTFLHVSLAPELTDADFEPKKPNGWKFQVSSD